MTRISTILTAALALATVACDDGGNGSDCTRNPETGEVTCPEADDTGMSEDDDRDESDEGDDTASDDDNGDDTAEESDDTGNTGDEPIDADGDGYPEGLDCDDNRPQINPGATEVCNGHDDDCDGLVDEGCDDEDYDEAVDADGDGWFGNVDCNDSDDSTYPGATELCDGADNDCDGEVDEGCSDEVDADGDGYNADDDCDDNNAGVNPGATEVCDDGIDWDCDGDPADRYTIWFDDDGDGYGWDYATGTSTRCPTATDAFPPGYVLNDDDCDDTDASTYPGASELNDLFDNDCDDVIDEGWLTVDVDSDAASQDWSLCWMDKDTSDQTYWFGGSEGCTPVSAGNASVSVFTGELSSFKVNGVADGCDGGYLVNGGPSTCIESIRLEEVTTAASYFGSTSASAFWLEAHTWDGGYDLSHN